MSERIDPDDAPELTGELAEVAERRIGGTVVRPVTDYLWPERSRARPPAAARRSIR